jgi:hypothetical protein
LSDSEQRFVWGYAGRLSEAGRGKNIASIGDEYRDYAADRLKSAI